MDNQIVVYFSTNNIGKYERYKKSFELAKIPYERYLVNNEGKEEKVDIKEDGKTTKENAEKKAKGYYQAYRKKYLRNRLLLSQQMKLYI